MTRKDTYETLCKHQTHSDKAGPQRIGIRELQASSK